MDHPTMTKPIHAILAITAQAWRLAPHNAKAAATVASHLMSNHVDEPLQGRAQFQTRMSAGVVKEDAS